MEPLTPALIGVLLIAISLLVYWVFVFIVLYHLLRFGIGTQPRRIAFVFLLGTIALFFVSVVLFAGLDFNLIGKRLGGLIADIFNTSL